MKNVANEGSAGSDRAHRSSDGHGVEGRSCDGPLLADEVFFEELRLHYPDGTFAQSAPPLGAKAREVPPQQTEHSRIHRWLWPEEVKRECGDERITAQDIEERCRTFYGEAHRVACETGERRAALCLSGGGIRSASFNLGILQLLAQWKMLGQFHFLSTVSGGGYIGSWLTAWAYNHKKGIAGVEEDLSAGKVPDPVRRLRAHSRYLSPRFSLFSADFWTLVATYLRNLFLHWIVFIPLLLAALLLPRIALAITESAATSIAWASRLPWMPGVPQQLMLQLAAAGVAWAFAYASLVQTSSSVAMAEQRRASEIDESDSEWATYRVDAEIGAHRRFFVLCLLPLSLGAALLAIYGRIEWVRPEPLAIGIASILSALLAGR